MDSVTIAIIAFVVAIICVLPWERWRECPYLVWLNRQWRKVKWFFKDL